MIALHLMPAHPTDITPTIFVDGCARCINAIRGKDEVGLDW